MTKLLFIELLLEATRGNDECMLRLSNKQFLNRSQQLTHQFKKLVDEHYLKLRTVQEYADLMFVSAKHLSDVLKQETGLSPLHLIHVRIFQQAKLRLCSTELSLKKIADELNFDTSSHFGRFFKQYAGYNPTDYRRIQCSII